MNSHAHATSPSIYSKILGILLALTVITVTAAGMDFGAGNVVIALVIATIKASLVALFFMHLRHDKPMSAIIFVTGMAMLAVFLTFCVLDTGSRDHVRPSKATAGTAGYSIHTTSSR
jgi:cytochrome c oxidase subunit IV